MQTSHKTAKENKDNLSEVMSTKYVFLIIGYTC